MKKLKITLLLGIIFAIMSSTSVFAANTTLNKVYVKTSGGSNYFVTIYGTDGFSVSFTTTEFVNINHKSNTKLVKGAQILLNGVGYKLDTDGSFGNLTKSAVWSYQQIHGLKIDGSCGTQTWKSLFSSLDYYGKVYWY